MFGGFLHGYGRRGIGHRRGRCRKSRPARVRPAPARLGLPVKRLTFVAIVIAEAFGILAGRRGFALRFAGEAAVAAAGGGLSNSIIIFVSATSAVARRARQHGQRRSPIFFWRAAFRVMIGSMPVNGRKEPASRARLNKRDENVRCKRSMLSPHF
jgi:hypothetical protein